jgi:hypothetical protein
MGYTGTWQSCSGPQTCPDPVRRLSERMLAPAQYDPSASPEHLISCEFIETTTFKNIAVTRCNWVRLSLNRNKIDRRKVSIYFLGNLAVFLLYLN